MYALTYFNFSRISKMMEKKGQEAETLMHIEEVLRKHDNDLEKQVQALQRENEECNMEKENLEEQWDTLYTTNIVNLMRVVLISDNCKDMPKTIFFFSLNFTMILY